MGNRPITRALPTQDSITYKNADMYPLVGFEPRTPLLEGLKTIRALDDPATGTDAEI
jgi:hypothetical protein